MSTGKLLLFGGKDTFGAYNANTGLIGVTNDVFISGDNGQTFTYVTGNPGWSVRSDMSVACNPGTDYVLMGGGQTNPWYLNVGDMWSTNDQGATWQTRATGSGLWGVFQDAAMVFMYDNYASQGSVYPNTKDIWYAADQYWSDQPGAEPGRHLDVGGRWCHLLEAGHCSVDAAIAQQLCGGYGELW